MSDLHDGNRLQQRIAATGQLIGDAHTAFLHDSIALMNSVLHGDVGSFVKTLQDIQASSAMMHAGVQALALQVADSMAQIKALALDLELLRERLTSYIDALPLPDRAARLAQIDDLAARVAAIEAREQASGHE